MLRDNTIARLQIAVACLSKVEPVNFSLAEWYGSNQVTGPKTPECGTQACFVGHAAFCPGLVALGLHLRVRHTKKINVDAFGDYSDEEVDPVYKYDGDVTLYDERYGTLYTPGDEYQSWPAVCAFFELTDSQAMWLFSTQRYPESNPGLSMVLERIQKFMSDHEKGGGNLPLDVIKNLIEVDAQT